MWWAYACACIKSNIEINILNRNSHRNAFNFSPSNENGFVKILLKNAHNRLTWTGARLTAHTILNKFSFKKHEQLDWWKIIAYTTSYLSKYRNWWCIFFFSFHTLENILLSARKFHNSFSNKAFGESSFRLIQLFFSPLLSMLLDFSHWIWRWRWRRAKRTREKERERNPPRKKVKSFPRKNLIVARTSDALCFHLFKSFDERWKSTCWT